MEQERLEIILLELTASFSSWSWQKFKLNNCYAFLSVSGSSVFASEFVYENLKCGVLALICRKGLGFKVIQAIWNYCCSSGP